MTFPNAHAKAQRREGPCGRPPKKNFAALRLCVIFFLLLFSVAATAQTNTLSDAEIQGRQLAQQLCDGQPTESFTNKGVFQIRDGDGKRTNIPVRFGILVSQQSWQSFYEIFRTNTPANYSIYLETDKISIIHFQKEPTRYEFEKLRGPLLETPNQPTNGEAVLENQLRIVSTISKLSGDDLLKPFGNSDFWLCDLGLEFFHWPAQKVLPKSTSLKRGRDYTLLESINPNPSTNGYSRVLSWIDKESNGILEADAYDAQGKLLKVFEPKSFKKVNGQWELQEMEIRNVQTGSRTRLEFDLKKN